MTILQKFRNDYREYRAEHGKAMTMAPAYLVCYAGLPNPLHTGYSVKVVLAAIHINVLIKLSQNGSA